MKKKNLLFLLPTILTITSCKFDFLFDKYKLTVVDNWDLLYEMPKLTYNESDVIEVKLQFRSGPRVGLLFEGENYYLGEYTYDEHNNPLYFTVNLTMPDYDTTLYTTFNGLAESPYDSYTSFEINYDYNFVSNQNKATLLYGYTLPFLDKSKYEELNTLIAGDLLYLYYNGGFLIKETYPGVVELANDFEVIDLLVIKADLKEISYEEYLTIKEELPKNIILNNDLEYESVEDYFKNNDKAYVSSKDNKYYALYSYLPRNN